MDEDFFNGLHFALFSAGGDHSKHFAPIAISKGVIVIDNSSAFRYDEDVPLIIPQVNGSSIGSARLIANPNCTTAIAAVVLNPIYQRFGLKKILMSTYQATSGAWAKGMVELLENTQRYIKKEEPQIQHFAHDIAFNLIPHIDRFLENGYTKEEMKVVWETHKIFGDSSIDISCTAVRIPILRAHSESIVLETKEKVDIDEVKRILRNSPGVQLVDDIEKNQYPMPIHASGKFEVEVGRIRKNLVFWEYGIELFVSGDQLLRGAALNAVEILEYIITHRN